MVTRYRVVEVRDDEEPIPDPDEEWVMTGIQPPEGDPPEGVRSPNTVKPDLVTPNFVPPDPVPLMQHKPEEEVDVPEAERANQPIENTEGAYR